MIDKVQKIREEVARIQLYTQSEVLKQVLDYIDEVQKEPVSNSDWLTELQEKLDNATPEQLEELWNKYNGVDGEESVSEELEKVVEEIAEPTILNAYGTKELARRLRNTICGTSVSEELGEAARKYFKSLKDNCFISSDIMLAFKAGAQWQQEKDSIPAEYLEELINKLSKQFPEVSFAKLSRIAVRVAKWQKQHLWKPADGDDLPEYDREVIAILDYDFGHYKVVYAHRPNPNGWNGTNIDTEEKEHFEPVIYDKGCWNQPHALYWLDAKLPYEENKIDK